MQRKTSANPVGTVIFLHDMQRGFFRRCSRKIKVWISVRNQHTQSTPKGGVCKNATENGYFYALAGEAKCMMKRSKSSEQKGEEKNTYEKSEAEALKKADENGV